MFPPSAACPSERQMLHAHFHWTTKNSRLSTHLLEQIVCGEEGKLRKPIPSPTGRGSLPV